MEGLSYINETDWRYDNWGTAELLFVTGTTLTDLPKTKSVTGTAFYQTAREKCFDLPTTNEIWLKFDVYFSGSARWRAYNGGTNGSTGITAQTNGQLSFFSNETNGVYFSGVCKTNQLQTVLLHMISGTSAGVVEAWVDGEFIYRYTGDVNHGEDFADIYLQSDGSGTFFSNVIISNAEIGLDENAIVPFGVPVIKPEIYISWIPTGKIGLKPQIYATYIPSPIHEKISGDLNRKLCKPESTSGDLTRQVGNGEKVSADISRHVISTDTAVAETVRRLFVEEKISGDTRRLIVQSSEIHADTYRDVQRSEKIIGDTSRKIGVTTVHADLQRRVNVTTVSPVDTCRRVEVEETTSADVFLKTTCAEAAHADTYRKVEDPTPTVTRIPTRRTVGIRETVQADTSRAIGYKESTSADTLLRTTSAEKIIADTMRGIREIIRADTFRRITRTEKFSARTVIRIPHILKYVIRNRGGTPKKILLRDTAASLINTFKDYGVTAINISLNEKTLSDEFTFDITQPMEINETVQGYLLDYPFHFIVEEITQTDLIRSVKGRYNVDEQLYTWFQMPYGDDGDDETGDNYPTATEAIQEIAGDLGLSADIHIDDFTPTNLQKGDMVTYSDVLNSVFSWTSRLPQRQINIFIRNGVLHCIQRGKETSVFDITNLSHSRPTINKKFNRVLCNNPNKSDNDDEEDNDDNTQPFSGVISYTTTNCKMRYEYKNGFLVSEYINFQPTYGARNNSSHITYKTYDYISFSSIKENDSTAEAGHYDDVIYYMASKTEQTITMEKTIVGDNIHSLIAVTTENRSETFSKTTYFYRSFKSDEIYLFLEEEESSRKEYSSSGNAWNKHVTNDESEPSIRETYHVPLGNGWYAQTVYLDGVLQGGNISQGAPGNKVSPYTVNQIQNIFNFKGVVEEDNGINDQLQAIVDYSFPVREQSIKKQLNADLRWLHQKIVETVTVDLVSKVASGVPEINHIVDFTERIKLDGAEYFLVSNKISFTPRKLIQKLQPIRWY